MHWCLVFSSPAGLRWVRSMCSTVEDRHRDVSRHGLKMEEVLTFYMALQVSPARDLFRKKTAFGCGVRMGVDDDVMLVL
jgi:hypothetical protein